MKEKRKKEKRRKSHKKEKKQERKSSSNSDNSEEWVEKSPAQSHTAGREDWMAMTGMLKTYTKEDIRPKREKKDKDIDSYNPSTSTRELNPYWKEGGTGLPQSAEAFRQSRQFLKPSDDDDYYTKSTASSDRKTSSYSKDDRLRQFLKPSDDDDYYTKSSDRKSSYSRKDNSSSRSSRRPDDGDYHNKSSKRGDRSSSRDDRSEQYLKPADNDDYYNKPSRNDDDRHKKRESDIQSSNWRKGNISNWRKTDSINVRRQSENDIQMEEPPKHETELPVNQKLVTEKPQKSGKYLSDEKMNKLGAKIVKAEIMGDTKLVAELKAKLEAAREYRKQNPDARSDDEDEGVMLIATNSSGNSRPLERTSKGDARSKGGKRKAETHMSGERAKYFGNDDKYNLAQMFTNEKYGNNYNEDAELARIASKSKNPNDDLEDIFMDEISKNRNEAKDSEAEKQRAINQHVKMEKTLEGCEYCLDSKNMLKHLMVSCGNKVYVALPARKSLVKDQCLISTVQHATCVTGLDEDVWEEILNYRKALTQFYDSQNKDVVFFETATRLHRFPHLVINCVPLPRDVGDMAAIYFKKALLECEAEWSMNKKVVDLKGKNIRKGVPKGLPYFWIDFGMVPGFAHVIEDQRLFPKTFAEEIIAGILDLDHSHWKNPRKEFVDLQRQKVIDFLNQWKTFDPTKNEK